MAEGFPRRSTLCRPLPVTRLVSCICPPLAEFVSWKDRKFVVPAFKAIYRAKNAEAGLKALAEFETSFWGQRYPAVAQSWQRNWEHVVPFFAYAESVRGSSTRRMRSTSLFCCALQPRRLSQSDAQLSSTGRACEQTAFHSQAPAQPRPQPPHSHSIIPIVPTFPPLRSIRLL